jgi:CubicO group peptidase (beta-lactamase class C family)
MNNKSVFKPDKSNTCCKLAYRLTALLLAILIPICFMIKAGNANAQEINDITPKKTDVNVVQTKNNQYGIGSVSKMFTTVAVMKLVDKGMLDLDTPLTYYIPEFHMADERYKQITPKMLLNHSSGIMGTTLHNAFLQGDADTRYHDDFLEQLKKQRLKAAPGEYSVYCNDGFTLAEILIERISGMSFSKFIKSEISEPMGLSNTLTPQDGLDETALAPTYLDNHILPYVNCQLLGSGGIYGTSEDLCKFSQIFMKDSNINLLSKESIDLMAYPWYQENQISVNKGDSQVGYGLGWDSVDTYPFNLYGLKALSKGGDVKGYHSNLTVLPEQNLTIAITSSGGSSSYNQEAAQDIILEVLKEEGLINEIKDIKVKAENQVDIAPLPSEMKQYEGYYLSQNMLKVEFNTEGTLLLKPIGTNYDTIQEYVYTKSGDFVSTKGYYMGTMGELLSNADGNKGLTRFSFRKESNGKAYIIGSTYESTNGLGEAALTMPLAEKIEPNTISETVQKRWKDRTDKKYYLVNEAYNSRTYLENPIINFKPLDEIPGYVTRSDGKNSYEISKIIDAATAKYDVDIPLMLGRDLFDYNFYLEDKTEYVTVESYLYAEEDIVKSSEELDPGKVILDENHAAWYEISNKDADTIITIEAPVKGAYYVYDKDNNCIASSLYKEESNLIMLPSEGHIVFTGYKGAIFQVSRE